MRGSKSNTEKPTVQPEDRNKRELAFRRHRARQIWLTCRLITSVTKREAAEARKQKKKNPKAEDPKVAVAQCSGWQGPTLFPGVAPKKQDGACLPQVLVQLVPEFSQAFLATATDGGKRDANADSIAVLNKIASFDINHIGDNLPVWLTNEGEFKEQFGIVYKNTEQLFATNTDATSDSASDPDADVMAKMTIRASIGVKLGFSMAVFGSAYVSAGYDSVWELTGRLQPGTKPPAVASVASEWGTANVERTTDILWRAGNPKEPPLNWAMAKTTSSWYFYAGLGIDVIPFVSPFVSFWLIPAEGCSLFGAPDVKIEWMWFDFTIDVPGIGEALVPIIFSFLKTLFKKDVFGQLLGTSIGMNSAKGEGDRQAGNGGAVVRENAKDTVQDKAKSLQEGLSSSYNSKGSDSLIAKLKEAVAIAAKDVAIAGAFQALKRISPFAMGQSGFFSVRFVNIGCDDFQIQVLLGDKYHMSFDIGLASVGLAFHDQVSYMFSDIAMFEKTTADPTVLKEWNTCTEKNRAAAEAALKAPNGAGNTASISAQMAAFPPQNIPKNACTDKPTLSKSTLKNGAVHEQQQQQALTTGQEDNVASQTRLDESALQPENPPQTPLRTDKGRQQQSQGIVEGIEQEKRTEMPTQQQRNLHDSSESQSGIVEGIEQEKRTEMPTQQEQNLHDSSESQLGIVQERNLPDSSETNRRLEALDINMKAIKEDMQTLRKEVQERNAKGQH